MVDLIPSEAMSGILSENENLHNYWYVVTRSADLTTAPAGATLLGRNLVLWRDTSNIVHAAPDRCPHREGVLSNGTVENGCLVCPYHGWTYDLRGRLRAAAREADFLGPFKREDWPLSTLRCQERAGLIWVALGDDPLPLEAQLDLLLEEAGACLEQPRQLLRRRQLNLDCNWKIAHDNTLDDYHVAIAHPTTLHREQGPVRHYRHAISDHATLLATPYPDGGEFLTFGLAPWTHLLLWPDGRLALIQFPPLDVERCRMEIWLLGHTTHEEQADAWMEQLQSFLEEDKRLVEAAQLGYRTGFTPGPAHRLERRILQQQSLYRQLMGISDSELLA